MSGFQETWLQKKKSNWAGQQLIYKKEIDSTNLETGRLSPELFHGAVIVAEAQTAGRGRRGRKWISESGENLYFSILLKPDFAPVQASMVTLVMAQAVAEAIEAVCGCNCQIKWPNDIVVCGKKVCGILTEMQVESDAIRYVVIGVGINVNQKEFEDQGLKYAGSLFGETGVETDRAELLAEVLLQFERHYEDFCKDGSLKSMKAAYEAKLANRNKEVRVLDPKGTYQGIALGINDKGELLLRREDGTEEAVFAGEVSVRGLWGYV